MCKSKSVNKQLEQILIDRQDYDFHFIVSYNTVLNPTALRKAKIGYNFGLSECSRVKHVSKIVPFHSNVKHGQ